MTARQGVTQLAIVRIGSRTSFFRRFPVVEHRADLNC
jgi:hypothetical protein